ncbi:MAG: hypothetical protein MUE69_13980 [Myxococcota bacterium]|nr:hypothetical protein [Myxococcota bacterium]
MLRIDFYVQHLVRHGATGIELVSGNPVKFHFPTGERLSNKPIDHAQVAQLVQEAAPPPRRPARSRPCAPPARPSSCTTRRRA